MFRFVGLVIDRMVLEEFPLDARVELFTTLICCTSAANIKILNNRLSVVLMADIKRVHLLALCVSSTSSYKTIETRSITAL